MRSGRFAPVVRARFVLLALVLGLPVILAAPTPVPASGPTPPPPFTALAAGYTAQTYGLTYSFLGQVGFVAGNPVVDECTVGHGGLIRFDGSKTVLAADGVTPVHPQVLPYLRSDVGCGLTNDSDGHLYAAVDNGVAQLDGRDGHFQRLFNGRTNTLGIVVDPVSKKVTYLDRACDIGRTGCAVHQVDTVTGQITTLAQVAPSDATFVDGMAWDPTGQVLLLNARAPAPAVVLYDRTGKRVQKVALAHEPDGIVFHTNPNFALLNDDDGTLSQLTFAPGDFSQPPAQSLLATGGFRGDLASAGADGCVYLTQDGSRVLAADKSVVRLCGSQGSFVAEFNTPPTTPTITTTASASVPLGRTIGDTATISGLTVPTGTGTITLRAYGPDDTTCTRPPVFSSAPVAVLGSGPYGASFTPTVAGTYRWVATFSGDPRNNPVTTRCDDPAEATVVTPQIMTGRAYAAAAKVDLSNVVVTAFPVTDTGSVATTQPGTVSPPCAASVPGAIAVSVGCASVVTALLPSRSSAVATVASVSINLPLVPAITVTAIRSESDTSCKGSVGKTTIGLLKVGGVTVISSATASPPNSGLNVLGVRLVLDEQVPVPGGLTVNALHVVVPGVADIVVASATSDIHNCP